MQSGKSADAELLPDLATLRSRSRQLNRDHPTAAGATNLMVSEIVGANGLRVQARCKADGPERAAAIGRGPRITEATAKRFNAQAERVWQDSDLLDDAGQQLLVRTLLESGEALVHPYEGERRDRSVTLDLDYIEPDRLMTPVDRLTNNNRPIDDGIEKNAAGRPVAYWIAKQHPGDGSVFLSRDDFDRVDAANIYHLYRKLRPGQSRGAPWLTPVMRKLHALDQYDKSHAMAALVQCCLAAVVKNTAEAGIDMAAVNADGTDAKGNQLQDIHPGKFLYLSPGEEIDVINPSSPHNNYDGYMAAGLRAVGQGLSVPYPKVSGDWGGVNYSNARTLLMEMRRTVQMYQRMLARLIVWVYRLVIEEAVLRGLVDAPDFAARRRDYLRAVCIPPGWEWIDPSKEVAAYIDQQKHGFRTYSDICAMLGDDFEELLERRVRERDMLEAAGLPFPVADMPAPAGPDESAASTDDEDADEDDDEPERWRGNGHGRRIAVNVA